MISALTLRELALPALRARCGSACVIPQPLFSRQDAVLRWKMALWARQVSRWCYLLKTARAAECPGSGPARACRGFAPLALLPSRNLGVLPWGLQAGRHVSGGSCSPPDSAKDGSFSSPESNLPSPVKQEQAKAETLPDLNAKILYEGKSPQGYRFSRISKSCFQHCSWFSFSGLFV